MTYQFSKGGIAQNQGKREIKESNEVTISQHQLCP